MQDSCLKLVLRSVVTCDLDTKGHALNFFLSNLCLDRKGHE